MTVTHNNFKETKEDKMAAPQQGPTPEFTVAYRDIMLMGLTNELQATKKVLAAIPDAKREYKPDPHARTAGELAWHLASTDVQMLDEIADRKFVMEPRFKDEPKTSTEMASWYETNLNNAIERVRAMSPEELLTPVDFYGAFNLPVVFYLAFVNNHSIHHRGQLATYLRPMGAKCPAIYGGSYDEPWQGSQQESNAA
jgi:uncharacterized damage-inducible protein DinB